ncbi:hypothetical protein H4R35_006032 [Dimargaris xerosporica]|nr:hypothetical protein H4R35_006032 [Dimargaris xerosporica]
MSLYSGLNLGKPKAPPTTSSSSDKKQLSSETSTPPTKGAAGWNTVFVARTARRKPHTQAPWGSKLQPSSAPPKSRESASPLDTSTHKPTTSLADTRDTATPNRLPLKPHTPLSSWPTDTEPNDQTVSTTTKSDVPFFAPPKGKVPNKGTRANPLAGLDQEYNPLAPNHYDQCKAALKQQYYDELIRKQTKRQRRLQQKMASRQGANLPASLDDQQPNDGPLEPTESTTLPPSLLPSNHANRLAPQSTVLLLCNMVGPGEVDDDLQEETMEECQRYGLVLSCKVFEATDDSIPSDKAVRIFVQFAAPDAAEQARQDLDGRYFGGRRVTATYFDPDQFARGELAP